MCATNVALRPSSILLPWLALECTTPEFAMADENTVLLRVVLDEGKTEERLGVLVLDIEKTRLAQQALNKARKDGAVDDASYAKQSVELQQQLKNQRTDLQT